MNNAVAFLFEEIRYVLVGVEVDRTRNVGITSTIKTFLLLNNNNGGCGAMENAGWAAPTSNVLKVNGDGEFNFCIPLKMLMGFAEDYTRIVLNVKQELILLRTSTDINATVLATGQTAANCVLELNKLYWKIPYVHVANVYRLPLLRLIEKDHPITIAFRTWAVSYTHLDVYKRQSPYCLQPTVTGKGISIMRE